MLRVRQQGKGGDVTTLHIMQEVAERRGVLTNQKAQTNKTLTEREEEVSARLPQGRRRAFCGGAHKHAQRAHAITY